MRRSVFIILVASLVVKSKILHAQCVPPAADECSAANVLCSLDEVNGYCCQNTFDIHSALYPCGANLLCPSAGREYVPHNTNWWALVTTGGPVTITITFSNCVNNRGVQMGIRGIVVVVKK